MTALSKYEVLEASAQWRASPEADHREVLLSFGKTTLVISDFNEAPLTHWSLMATHQIAQGQQGAAVFAADDDGHETLEVTDPLMIEAITAISDASRRGKSGSNRRWPLRLLAVAMLAGMLLWQGPGLLRQQARALITGEHAVLLSDRILARLPQACTTPDGSRALQALLPGVPIRILPLDQSAANRLPDGRILLSNTDLVETGSDAADVLSKLSAAQTAPDVLTRWSRSAPLSDIINLLRAGALSPDQVSALAEIATTGPASPSTDTVAGITDQQWVALQGICDR